MLRGAGLLIRLLPALCLSFLCSASPSPAQTPPPTEAGPVLKQLILDGATIFTAEDVRWLLELREGARLPGAPEPVAAQLQRRYEREGYTAAKVAAEYDAASGALTLRVDEGRIDVIDIQGLRPDVAERYRKALRVRPGDVYNRRIVGRDVSRVLADTNGSVRVGRPRNAHGVEVAEEITLIDRSGQRVLVIPLRDDTTRFKLGTGTGGREDLYNPVDAFTPALDFESAIFDPDARNYTFFSGFASYKFGPERPGYSLGAERSMGGRARWYLGGQLHDLTATDDEWRLSSTEQTLVAIAFKNTFRDYYRRRGVQLHSAVRAGGNHEVVAAWRRDRHEPLANTTNYSFFRDDRRFRENPAVDAADVRAVILGYTYDSRGLDEVSIGGAYRRHLVDDLFRGVRRQRFGWRFDWTGELAGKGLGGDHEYQRHIFNTRAYVPLAPRQSLAARLLLGESDGALPVERRFALGGVGTVHGYRFKEAVGQRMALVNLEYRLDLSGDGAWGTSRSGLAAFFFYDAGRVGRPLIDSTSSWLNGIGLGLQAAFVRIEVGFRASDIPGSRQILVRLEPTF